MYHTVNYINYKVALKLPRQLHTFVNQSRISWKYLAAGREQIEPSSNKQL